MEEKLNRKNWIAVQNNGRYIVVDKMTGTIVYDAQGYGFRNESKCWNWIRYMQRQVGIELNEPPYNTLILGKNEEYRQILLVL
jgi:hypothetical protein